MPARLVTACAAACSLCSTGLQCCRKRHCACEVNRAPALRALQALTHWAHLRNRNHHRPPQLPCKRYEMQTSVLDVCLTPTPKPCIELKDPPQPRIKLSNIEGVAVGNLGLCISGRAGRDHARRCKRAGESKSCQVVQLRPTMPACKLLATNAVIRKPCKLSGRSPAKYENA